MEKPTPPLGRLISLLMFPQIVETIYSPTLPEISGSFAGWLIESKGLKQN